MDMSICLCSLLALAGAAGVPAHHAPSRFTSHVSVQTPAHSFSHGVGDVVGEPAGGAGRRYHSLATWRNTRLLPYTSPGIRSGYTKQRPAVPFYQEDFPLGNSLLQPSWHSDLFIKGGTIPVLPASPYSVNSANPESLWPEGLFIPPSAPVRGFPLTRHAHAHGILAKKDDFDHPADNSIVDPFLLSDEEALQALDVIKRHGELFFHDIPHERSLLHNQQMRLDNGLAPHRLGSIRHTWIYFRP